MNKILVFILIFILFLNNKAFAYLDPGTGSIILQGIVGAIAAGASYCAIYWQKLKNFFNRKSKEKNKD
jgi:hypothetical protein|tara:strand:+ start:314 stop:517 length:204 start_codon:yes stop_codon:yes gene_type:complete